MFGGGDVAVSWAADDVAGLDLSVFDVEAIGEGGDGLGAADGEECVCAGDGGGGEGVLGRARGGGDDGVDAGGAGGGDGHDGGRWKGEAAAGDVAACGSDGEDAVAGAAALDGRVEGEEAGALGAGEGADACVGAFEDFALVGWELVGGALEVGALDEEGFVWLDVAKALGVVAGGGCAMRLDVGEDRGGGAEGFLLDGLAGEG